MLERLGRGPAPVTELARPLPMSLPAAMQHLGALELTRVLHAPRSAVYRASAKAEHVKRWFPPQTFDAVYHDVVPGERLICSYRMFLDDRKISVSLATLQLQRAAPGTKLRASDQGAFLDGYDDAGAREAMSAAPIRPFGRFYRHYLTEHRHPICRLLHYIGSWLVIAFVVASAVTSRPLLLIGAPLAGYGCAWVGHFLFEKNAPATFRQPWFSLAGDWVLWRQITRGKAAIRPRPTPNPTD